MSEQIPLVDYLVLGDQPHLVANECTSCGARYFDRRNACASCFGTEFKQVPVATDGTVNTFTIVAFAAPGIPVPFVSAVVDCDGTPVRGNLINVEPDPDHVSTGMKVRLATYSLGTDDNGTEAIGFGFEPRRATDRSPATATVSDSTAGSTPMSASDEIWILGIHMTKFGKHPDKDTVDLAAEAVPGRPRRTAACR